METEACQDCADQLLDFLNFLRGMETQDSGKEFWGTRGFLNFLRGMETPLGHCFQ